MLPVRRALACLAALALAATFLVLTPGTALATPTTPSAPQSLHAETATNGVWLTWAAPADNGGAQVTYTVLRGTAADNLASIGTAPGTTYGDQLSGTTPTGTGFVYAVQASNTAGAGPVSSTASAATPATELHANSTAALSTDLEPAGYPYDNRGETLAQGSAGVVTQLSADGNGIRMFASDSSTGSTRNFNLYVRPPTGQFLVAGSLPVATTADATHATVSLSAPDQTCLLYTGTLDVTTLTRDVTGTPVLADLDVSGTCQGSNSPLATSLRVGIARSYSGLALPSYDAGPVVVGHSANVPVVLTNTGTASRHISSVALTSPAGSIAVDWALTTPDTCSGQDVAPGASCTATAVVTPTAGGDRPAVVVISDDSGLQTHHRDLTALGVVAPLQPAGFSSSRQAGQVTLSWYDSGDNSDRASSFEVLRGTSASDATVRATLPNANGTVTYTDPDTTDGTRYYAVRGVNAAGAGPAVSSTLDLALRAPTNVHAAVTTLTGTLTWSAPAGTPRDPITGYNVYRGGSTSTLAHWSTPAGTAVTIPPIPAGQHVYYKVAAITSSGTGPFSGVLDVVGVTSQLVVAGLDGSRGPDITVRPLTLSTLATPVTENSRGIDDVSVSPNGKLMAFSAPAFDGATEDDIFVGSVDGRTVASPVVATSDDEWSPAWSPDGKWLAFTVSSDNGDTVCKVPAAGGARTCVSNSAIVEPSWLDNNRVIVSFEAGNQSLAIGSFGSATLTFLAGTAYSYGPAVSPDGSRVAFGIFDGSGSTSTMRVSTISNGQSTAIAVPPGFTGTPSWTRDSASLYYPAVTARSAQAYRSAANGTGTAVAVTDPGTLVTGVAVSTPDTTPPVVKLSGVPVSTVAKSVKPLFSATDALNGVAYYTLAYRKASYGSAFSAATSLKLTAPTGIDIAVGYTYCYSVRATDRVGNTSAATPEQCTTKPMDDRSLVRSSAFSPITGSGYYAGTAMRTSTRGATLTRSGVTSAKQLFLLATTCSSCGSVDVLIGSARVASVSLVSAATSNLRLIALPAFSARNGTVTIRVTSSGKNVTIDGLGVRK